MRGIVPIPENCVYRYALFSIYGNMYVGTYYGWVYFMNDKNLKIFISTY